MIKLPYWAKIQKIERNGRQITTNIKVKKWAWPIFAFKASWEYCTIKPRILKPFICIYFAVAILFVEKPK